MLPRLFGVMLLILVIGFSSVPALAQTDFLSFSVNTTADAVDMNVGDGICAANTGAGVKCTLRAAIQEANALSGSTFISVNNAGGVMQLSIAGGGENAALTGDLDVTSFVTIVGPGTINGGGIDRIFHIHNGGTLDLLSITLTGGQTPATENGGAILVEGNGSSLRVVSAQISNNTATSRGGALRVQNGATADIQSASIIGNTAVFAGGGISVIQASLTLTNTTVYNNTVTNGSGGGIAVENSNAINVIRLNNVTIASNAASNRGGGLVNFDTIRPVLTNTVLDGNTAINGSPNCAHVTNDSVFESLGNNLIANTTGCLGATIADLTNVSAGLAAATVIFGMTHLKPASTSSNVVNAGGTFSCAPTDAIGTSRPQGSGCDIGAIELAVGFAGSILATPTAAIGEDVTITVSDPDLRFLSSVVVTATTRVNDQTFETESLTLQSTGNATFSGIFPVQLNSVAASGNEVLDILGEGMIIFSYTDTPNGQTEGGSSNRIAHTQVRGLQDDAIVNPSFELDANKDKIPDGWKASNLSSDKRRCNKVGKPPVAIDGSCVWQMKNATGTLKQVVPLPLPAGIDDDMFLEVLVNSNAPRPGTIASIKVKHTNGIPARSCKITLLAGTNSGAGGYQAFQCNIEPDLDHIKKMTVKLSTPKIGGGKVLYDRVSLLILYPRTRSTANTDSLGVLPPPAAPDGFRSGS